MKKKKLLKRIEELETMYKELLFEDNKLTIDVKRLEYKIKEDIEYCFFFGLSSGVTEFKTPLFKRHPFDLIDKYWLGLQSLLFVSEMQSELLCNPCKLPMLVTGFTVEFGEKSDITTINYRYGKY